MTNQVSIESPATIFSQFIRSQDKQDGEQLQKLHKVVQEFSQNMQELKYNQKEKEKYSFQAKLQGSGILGYNPFSHSFTTFSATRLSDVDINKITNEHIKYHFRQIFGFSAQEQMINLVAQEYFVGRWDSFMGEVQRLIVQSQAENAPPTPVRPKAISLEDILRQQKENEEFARRAFEQATQIKEEVLKSLRQSPFHE